MRFQLHVLFQDSEEVQQLNVGLKLFAMLKSL